MSANSPIVGVTGHIRFNESGTQEFKVAVNKLLSLLEKQYSTCAPSLASGLAVGADLEVASLALTRGWRLIAVLAGPENEFVLEHTEQSKALFVKLLESSSEVIVAAATGTNSPEKYCLVGVKIIDLSDQLIAIWDGNLAAPKQGGAAWVVNQFLSAKTENNLNLHQILVTR